jgi:hypothetical protein
MVPYSIQWLMRLRTAWFRHDLLTLFELLQFLPCRYGSNWARQTVIMRVGPFRVCCEKTYWEEKNSQSHASLSRFHEHLTFTRRPHEYLLGSLDTEGHHEVAFAVTMLIPISLISLPVLIAAIS